MKSAFVLFSMILLLGCIAPPPEIKSFDDCVKAGYPVLESFPRQCKTPDGRTFISEEDQNQILKNIRTFDDCEATGFPIMESYPRQCRTSDGRTFVSQKDRFDIDRNISCQSDQDCELANSDLGFQCCYAGACEPIDYSLDKWIAVNTDWYIAGRTSYCPAKEECGPAPGCAAQAKNLNYSAKCIARECRKVPIRCTSDQDCGSGASCWFKTPAGPSAGTRGSPENPGTCWDDEVISAIVAPFEGECCTECARAFSMSPVGSGPEGTKCGSFSSAYEMSAFCEQYFGSHPTIVSQCTTSLAEISFTPGACNALDQNGPMDEKLNIIFVPSHHYTDMSDFASDVPAFRNALRDFPFFDDNEDKINFFFLASTSASDGCYLAGNTTPACNITAVRTIASACSYDRSRDDQIVVVFDNDEVATPYARGEVGEDILFIGSDSHSVFAHEFSHSFGDLGDTYDGYWNNTVDSAYPNCASSTPGFTCADKWGDLIGTGSGDQLVGCYQNCHAENWYRPTLGGDVMRNLGYDFYDPVALRHMQQKMNQFS